MGSNTNLNSLPFEQAVLKARVAQLCDHVGYHAITQDSSNVLVDIYRRMIINIAHQCKDAAITNRRTEATVPDLLRAYDIVGIKVAELQEHIETVKLPELEVGDYKNVSYKPSNRIQRNVHVDDLLEAEKNNQAEDQAEGDVTMGENGAEEEEKPKVPLLKDTFQEIAAKFGPCTPVKADKEMRNSRLVVVASKKLKIKAPLPPEPVPSTSEKVSPIRTKVILPQATPTKEKVGRKKKIKEPLKKVKLSKKGIKKVKSKVGRKKTKTKAVTPLDPSIAEPPSFLNILDSKIEDQFDENAQEPFPSSMRDEKFSRKSITPVPQDEVDGDIAEPPPEEKAPPPRMVSPDSDEVIVFPPAPEPSTSKPARTKGKNKKKSSSSSSKFAIITEAIPSAQSDAVEYCPRCGGPDDGSCMIQCDRCEKWWHLKCTKLKKEPGDDEPWDCENCVAPPKIKTSKKPSPKVPKPEKTLKTKTPDMVLPPRVPTPPPVILPPPIETTGDGSQDYICPICHQGENGIEWVQCEDPECINFKTDTWFHIACVGLTEKPGDDETWFCKDCIEKQQSAFKRRRRAK